MHELIVNLHMHTTYSDGSGTHAEIAQAALQAGVDAVIVTDHNVLVSGLPEYYQNGDHKVLLLIGEEIHDQTRRPQKNHLLVFGHGREIATLAYDPVRLLEAVRSVGGLAFIAHPVDPAAPAFNEPDISWVDWDLQDYAGLELWNAMSEFKLHLKSKARAAFYAFNPRLVARGPFPEALARWDSLLDTGRRVVAIGGSDAHALPVSLGPIKRSLFPYEFHFRAVNTHLFVPEPLIGEAGSDRRAVYEALRLGRAFIGYDLPAPTRGFRFTAQGSQGTAWMGDEIAVGTGVTLQISLPRRCECRLLKDGKLLKTWRKREICTYITNEPGVYRVEAYHQYLGRRRGWIFSNPIYLRS
jgi:hypothetical protein